MSRAPITLAVPQRLIDVINDYCISNRKKNSEFFEETMAEYAYDKQKIANAVSNRIMSNRSEVGEVRRMSKRIDPAPCSNIRAIAHQSDLGFDSLTRIIIEDRLVNLGLIH